MMTIGILFLVFVAVLIPLAAIVGAVYVGWLAETRPRGDGLREVTRPRPRRRRAALRARPDAFEQPRA